MESFEGRAGAPDSSSGDDDSTTNNSEANNSISDERYAALRNHQIRFEDAIDPNADRISEIDKMDVVFGRGRGLQKHPGNIRMREVVEKHKTRYHSLNRKGKRKLAVAVHKEISEGGIRFLKKLDNEEVWVIVDRPIAIQKVTHTLRCRKSVLKQMAKEDAEVSSAETHDKPLASSVTDVPASTVYAQGVAGASSITRLDFSNTAMPPLGIANISMRELEAQRFAALERYRALAGLPPLIPPQLVYYEMMRREQLIRETALLQQMGDSVLMNLPTNRSLSSASLAPSSKPLVVSRSSAQKRKNDETSDPTTGGSDISSTKSPRMPPSRDSTARRMPHSAAQMPSRAGTNPSGTKTG
eukprot:scaffold5966_cov118-Cylindrotheca_fusiformis.AAC.29